MSNAEPQPTSTSTSDHPDVDELREQIDQTREELAQTVEALAAKVDVKTRVKDTKDNAVEKLPPSVRAQTRNILLVGGGVVLVAVGWMFKRSRNA
jgi:hypothetical protein